MMGEVALWGFGLKMLYACAAVALLWALLRTWNHLTGNRFDDTFEEVLNDPLAGAVYYGLRFVGLCLLVGKLLS